MQLFRQNMSLNLYNWLTRDVTRTIDITHDIQHIPV